MVHKVKISDGVKSDVVIGDGVIGDGVILLGGGVKSGFYNFLLHLNLLCLLLGLATSSNAQTDLQVYVFIGEDCPICNYMGKPLSTIAKKYGDRVDFHAVFPVKRSNYKTAQLFKEQYDMMSFETILDKDLTLTKKLGATVTPEVVITDAFGEVRYRGRINSAYYAPGKMKHSSIKDDLDEVLAILLSGKAVPQPWPASVGCFITMYASK